MLTILSPVFFFSSKWIILLESKRTIDKELVIQSFIIFCVAYCHCWWFNTRNSHRVHFDNSIRFSNGVSKQKSLFSITIIFLFTDHCWWFNTPNVHVVHIVNSIRLKKWCINYSRSLFLYNNTAWFCLTHMVLDTDLMSSQTLLLELKWQSITAFAHIIWIGLHTKFITFMRGKRRPLVPPQMILSVKSKIRRK